MPEYALILLFVLLVSAISHYRFKLKLYTSKTHLLYFLLITLSLGIVWDGYAITRGHWSFGEQYLLGITIGPFPIEELGFMLIFPYSLLVMYKFFAKFTKKSK